MSAPNMYPPQQQGVYPPPLANMYPPTGGAGRNPMLASKIEIHVSCNELENKDALSKSDPIVVMYLEVKHEGKKTWREYGRTEVIQNTLSPNFTQAIAIDYHFEEYQKLKFQVFDSDSVSNSTKHDDFLGYFEITLGSLVGEFNGKVKKPLVGKNNKALKSTIVISAEELNDNKEIAIINLKGVKLDKKDTFGASDPFLVFHRHGIESNDYTAVHKTEVIKNTLNPHWSSFTIPLVTLCNGDKFRPIKIECFDWDSDGSHDMIGECQTTIDQLLTNPTTQLELIHPVKIKKKKNYKNSGCLQPVSVTIETKPSFLDYITNGVEICCDVAVDFTASNGAVSSPNSLHYQNPYEPNQYVRALQSVGQICEDYDTDKLIPAYGFGARINGQVYHNFHLNQTPNPNCFGMHSVITAYQQFLQTVELYGPTNFSPVINSVAGQIVSENNLTSKYHVLLILTDGIITDMNETKMAIINASKLPLSIIIVGLGNADFDAMDELDCDNGKLKSNGKIAERDMVQFVPFRKFSGAYAGDSLAREVLRELPQQLVTYMMKNGIQCKSN